MNHLQRTAGNAAVVQWLGKGKARRPRRVVSASKDETAATDQHVTVAQRSATVQREEEKDEPSPEEQFLDDVDSGLEKAKEYLEYMPKALDYWKQVGGEMPAGLAEAAENLAKISERITGGLDKVSGVLKKAKQLVEIKKWAESVADTAQATRALNLADKASRDAWIASVDRLGKSSGTFVDAAGAWLKELAIAGDAVASRAFIVLGALKAYGEIGWAALKAGMKNVEAYIDRFGFEGTEMAKVRKEEGSWTPPPEPAAPSPWTSAAEKEASRRAFMRKLDQMAKEDQRRQRLAPVAEKVRKAEAGVDDAKKQFDSKGFAKAYRRRRDKLLYRIAREMRYGKRELVLQNPQGGLPTRIERGVGSRWYDQFVDSGAASYTDEVAGMDVAPKKERVGLEDAQREIDGFRTVDPTCPWFNDIYAEELEKFMAKARAALTAANAEYSAAAAAATAD